MRFSIILSLVALTLAFPNADPLANPFALDPRSVGGKCDHGVSRVPRCFYLVSAFNIHRASKAPAKSHAKAVSRPSAIVPMVRYILPPFPFLTT